jgi:hypothetical protein
MNISNPWSSYCNYCLAENDLEKLDWDSRDKIKIKHCPSFGATLYDYPVCPDLLLEYHRLTVD